VAGYVEDTIAAVATPAGSGAIAIVRMSGGSACDIARRVLRRDGVGPQTLPRLVSHRAVLALLCEPDGGGVIDQVLVLPMLAPGSFTGEDVVEIHCHGSVLIAERALRTLLAAGARAARPGEFTERAFLNGKLDLCQAEAVADLIEASSEAGRVAAWQHLAGSLSRQVAGLRDSILDVRALVEAHLDFPEDELPSSAEHEITTGVEQAVARIDALATTFARGRLAREGVRVALVGKPNVGKSSLMNALLGRERALVSDQAGTTRDYLEEPAALGALRVLLCDTAGLRGDADPVERAGIERTREVMAASDVVVVVLDSSLPLDDMDRAVLAAAADKPRLVVRNKVDLPPAWSPDPATIGVSTVSGTGLDALGGAIVATLPEAHPEPASEPVVVTRARHHEALLLASAALVRAVRALRGGLGLEIVSCELQVALLELDRLVGASDVEDLLDRIFSRFCIGK
jgi:tRNA modification GTPase